MKKIDKVVVSKDLSVVCDNCFSKIPGNFLTEFELMEFYDKMSDKTIRFIVTRCPRCDYELMLASNEEGEEEWFYNRTIVKVNEKEINNKMKQLMKGDE